MNDEFPFANNEKQALRQDPLIAQYVFDVISSSMMTANTHIYYHPVIIYFQQILGEFSCQNPLSSSWASLDFFLSQQHTLYQLMNKSHQIPAVCPDRANHSSKLLCQEYKSLISHYWLELI